MAMQPSTVFCMELPHCQHSATPLLLKCTVTMAPYVYKLGYNNILLLLQQNRGRAARRQEGIERYTNGVWCRAFTVEKCNGENI